MGVVGMRVFLIHLAVIATIASSRGVSAWSQSPLEITTKRDTDRAEVQVEHDKAIITLHSPHGISEAVIRRTAESWPRQVTLHLHLKGLEHFKVTSGKLTLNAAVLSHESPPESWQWRNADKNLPLDAQRAYNMKIRPIDKEGNPATKIPLQDGYFEIQFPPALLEENPKSIAVSWIDFYR